MLAVRVQRGVSASALDGGGSMTKITDRMDVAIERAKWRYPESPPKRICLDEQDWREYDQLSSEEWGGPVHAFSYRDLQIFPARRSRLFTKHGCMVAVPKALGSRARAA